MIFPGVPSLFFLAFLLVLVPLAARRTAQRLRKEVPGKPVSRLTYWRSAAVFQVFLFFLAWRTGATFDYKIFAVRHVTATDLLLSAAALALCFGFRELARRTRSEEEFKGLSVFQRVPRTGEEFKWYGMAVVGASVAEEAAYRGVGWSILWYSLGDPWISAALMSVAFALAHWNQGWKSGVTITAFAAIFHGLVALTETLVFAMVVHAAYDFIAGASIQRTARRLFPEQAANGDQP